MALEGTGGGLAIVGMSTDSTLGLLEGTGVGTGDGFALALGPVSPTSEG